GRIPLNTAGNLAGGGPGNGGTHAAHLGNSVSEIDPTYGLQNGFQINTSDAGYAFTTPVYGTFPYYPAQDSQVDTGGIDVRLTQLRNLLAGTRPQTSPGVPGLSQGQPGSGQINGDNNVVLINGWTYFMPNNVADPNDAVIATDGNGNPYVQRMNPPVAGRWGEADSVSGGIDAPNAPNQINGYVNLVQDGFT